MILCSSFFFLLPLSFCLQSNDLTLPLYLCLYLHNSCSINEKAPRAPSCTPLIIANTFFYSLLIIEGVKGIELVKFERTSQQRLKSCFETILSCRVSIEILLPIYAEISFLKDM